MIGDCSFCRCRFVDVVCFVDVAVFLVFRELG